MEKEKEKTYTEMQSKFLVVLFGEAKGNLLAAKRLAGYAEATTVAEVISPLKEEILKQTTAYFAAHMPKAAMKIVSQLDQEAPNANVFKAADSILNRAGVTEKKDTGNDITLSMSGAKGGFFILPAKDVQVYEKIKLEETEE